PSLLPICAAATPTLHPLPTRRSSDLLGLDRGPVRPGEDRAEHADVAGRQQRGLPAQPNRGGAIAAAGQPFAPAEQRLEILRRAEIGRAHVELQSRVDLVCRLLLEKKK